MSREQQRKNLYSTIWKIAEEQRCAIDGWDFKQYILGTLFYRFISEELISYVNNNEWKSGNKDFNYADLDDNIALKMKSKFVEKKGFFILPSELFSNIVKNAKNDEKLNETLKNIFNDIEGSAMGTKSESNIKGLFADFDTNNNKLGNTVLKRNERLYKLLIAISGLDFGNFKDSSIDLFGDCYEYLMSMYASNAGKSGGEFFTPQEVSELLAKLTIVNKTYVNKVYDPCCGSGSLLLKFANILGEKNCGSGFYGQELNPTTYNLCRINMFLHNINFSKFNIQNGDTLVEPKHWDLEPFEAIVSNPPYSVKWEGDNSPTLINDPRFCQPGVLAPKSKADLAFTLHMLHWLAPNGVAAIVEFPGVLYRSGAEQKIRQWMVENNYVDCVIQLPSDLFFGTSIATCILVLKKSKKDSDILFIDASKEFIRESASNKLSHQNIENIINAFKNRSSVDYFCTLTKKEDIQKNDFNLSVSRYVKTEDKTEIIDIQKLQIEWENIVLNSNHLRLEIKSIIKNIDGIYND